MERAMDVCVIQKQASAMGSGTRRVEGLSGPSGPMADVVVFPFSEVRSRIAQGKDVCEMLREYIGAIRQHLAALEDDIGKVDARAVREAFQLQLVSMNETLQRGLDQLSRTEKLLEDTLRSTHRCGSFRTEKRSRAHATGNADRG